MEAFRAKYHIPQGVVLRYCPPEGVLLDRDVGEVVIPMIAFIQGGMTLLMRRITRDYLFHHRLTLVCSKHVQGIRLHRCLERANGSGPDLA